LTIRLRVRNFQALADVKIEAQGLTVITGPTNLGKTALIRAINAMLFGAPGEHFIRRGEDFAGGAILIEDDKPPLKVIWKKVATAKKKPNLQSFTEINGVQHTKTGRGHSNLTNPFGVVEIETLTQNFRPQIAMQHDPVFLVGANETSAAELFKVLGRADVVADAQANAKKDLKDISSRAVIRTEDKRVAVEELEKLTYVPVYKTLFSDLKAKITAEIKKMEATNQQLVNLRHLKTLYVTTLPTPPTMPTSRRELLKLCDQLKSLQISPVPEKLPEGLLEDCQELTKKRGLTIEFKSADTQWKQSLVVLSNVEKNIGIAKKEIQDLEVQLGVCPTCNRQFGPEHEHQVA